MKGTQQAQTVQADAAASGMTASRRGAALDIVLDRPAAMNAIDGAMRATLAAAIRSCARDPNLYGVLLSSALPKAFSVGGDVRELHRLVCADPLAADAALADEYALNWLLECFSKPTIALIDGIAMGTGVGISLYATHRAAGAGYAFAMPETAIGFFPDDGVAHRLARLPSSIGSYLALTGRRIGRADAYHLGLVTHCIEAAHYDHVRTRFADADPVDPLLDGLHVDPGPGELPAVASLIDDHFDGANLGDIFLRLAATIDRGKAGADWCRKVEAELLQRSPLALAVSLRHVVEAGALDLRHTLMIDHRLGCRLAAAPDFVEGVRAHLIDKDRRPRWQPAALTAVTPAMVERCFAPMPNALMLPTRQEMQAMRV